MPSPEPRPRPRRPLFERLKIPALLAAYIAVMEWVDPLPWRISLPARVAVAALVFFVARELHLTRCAVDPAWAARSERVEGRARLLARRVPQRTWLRFQRVAVWTVLALIFGALLNSITDRCDTAVGCAVTAPRMALENLPFIVMFMVQVALVLLQIGIMFWALIKVGSWKIIYPGTSPVTFADVWGQDAARDKVMEQVRLLEDSERVEAAGAYMPKGLLLYGPPGTGKTLLARAAAGESSKPLILVPPGAFVSTFWGINLLKVWMLFRLIRKLARRYGGIKVFMDEMDALGSRGGEVEGMTAPAYVPGCVPFRAAGEPPVNMLTRGSNADALPRRFGVREIVVGNAQMGTLEAFLSALDGMDEPRGTLNRLLVFCGFKPLKPPTYKALFMGATNRPGALDKALLRPGRMSRLIHVDYPKYEGRLHTYQGYLARVSHALTSEQVEWAARNHERGTGDEIRHMVNEALLATFRDGRENPGVVQFGDLVTAMAWVRFGESEGPFERELGRWSTAVHEAGHAVAFHHLLPDRCRIWFASIDRRGKTGGMVVPTMLDDDWTRTREEMMRDIQIAFASRVAEQMFFGEATNGNAGDNLHATAVARQMVLSGLGPSQIGATDDERAMRREVEQLLGEALTATRALLGPRRHQVQAVAELLMERTTVPGDEVHALLGET